MRTMDSTFTKVFFLSLGIGFMLTSRCQATAYTYSSTLLVSQSEVQNEGPGNDLELFDFVTGPQPTFDLNIGDTLSGTFTFSSPVAISSSASLADIIVFVFKGSNNPSYSDGYSTTTTLLGVNGTLSGGHNPYVDSQAGEFDSTSLQTYAEYTKTNFSFTGFSYSITLNNLIGPEGVTPNEFYIQAPDITVASVPEPSTYALLLGGAGLLIFSLKRTGGRRL